MSATACVHALWLQRTCSLYFRMCSGSGQKWYNLLALWHLNDYLYTFLRTAECTWRWSASCCSLLAM
jgi:hypothetical protein